MKRHAIQPRIDWQQQVEALGFYYHTIDQDAYWDESAYYEFTPEDIHQINQATAALHSMCMAAVAHVIEHKAYAPFHFPDWFIPVIEKSWVEKQPSIYGRFDLAYDGCSPPKMLEYNAGGSAGSLFESAVVQRYWQQSVFPVASQYNDLTEKLIQRWAWVRDTLVPDNPIYFSCLEGFEEVLGNTEYMRACAMQAGLVTEFESIQAFRFSDELNKFLDSHGNPVQYWFKFYPWLWTWEDFGTDIALDQSVVIFEPAWRAILDSKAVLPVLWQLFPEHPNLLPSYFELGSISGDYVCKPVSGGEGALVAIHTQSESVHSENVSDALLGQVIYQQYQPLPCFEGNYPVVGAWVVGEEPAGLGMREDRSRITQKSSRFIPHLVSEA